MNNQLLNEVLPVALEKCQETPHGFHSSNPYSIIIALMKNGDLKGIFPQIGYCLSKSKGDKVLKYFRASSLSDAPWSEAKDGAYCCGFPKMSDEDLPLNWKENLSVEIGRGFLLGSNSNGC